MFGFYFGSILGVSSGHCCVYFFRVFFGVHGFTYGSLLFLSFSFVVLRMDSLVEELSSLTHAETRLRLTFCGEFSFSPQLFFSVALIL